MEIIKKIKKITNSVKNMKTSFKRICNKYLIKDSDKLYYQKIFKKTENKYSTITEEFYVPILKELNNLLFLLHFYSMKKELII